LLHLGKGTSEKRLLPAKGLMSDRNPLQTTESREQLFEMIFTHIPGAVRYACHTYQRSLTQSEFEDICHDVIILLLENDYRRLRTFKRKSSVKTWIYAIARRHLRRQLRETNLTISLDDIASDSLVCRPRQENAVLSGERWKIIYTTISQWPKRSQSLLELSVAGFSDIEISNLLGIKADAVRKHRFELVKKLRNLFQNKSV